MRFSIQSFAIFALLAAALAISSSTFAAVYHFQGVSTLLAFGGQPPAYGVAGEQVSITFDLDTNDFYMLPVVNPVFHYFVPNKTVPVHVTGSVSGQFPNVSPIDRVLALELTASQATDLLTIDNVGGNLYDSFCRRTTCFDGAIRPHTPDEMFDLLERSMVDSSRWRLTTANPSVGLNNGNNSIVLDRNIVWTVSRTPPTPYTQIDVVADADGQYTAQTGTLNTTGTSAIVGVDSMTREALMEFPLAAIPAGATIKLAQLELRPFVSSGAPSLEVRGYQGDGVLTLADVSAPSSLLATTGPVSVSTGMLFDLDTEYIQGLVGTSSHLGIRMRSLDAIDYVGFSTIEAGGANPPTLLIRYVLPLLAGDFSGDGIVDAADFTVWRDALGVEFDAADYDVWKQNFGATAGSASAFGASSRTAVPEATSLLMIMAAVLMLGQRVRHTWLGDG